MSVFATLSETRQLGAPVVGLFRTALARDPGPLELETYARAVKNRVPPVRIAGEIVATAEFRRRYGHLARAELVDALCRNAFGPALENAGVARLAAELAGTEAEIVAAISEAGLARGAIPLLPGLAPGAPPDDPVAYALWVDEYDRQLPVAVGDTGGALVSLVMIAGDTEAEAVERTVASLAAQSHANWELCLAAKMLSPWSQQTITGLAEDDRRVRLVDDHDLTAALSMAVGPLVALLAPGDRLAPTALQLVVAAFDDESTRLVFTDEDVMDYSGRHSPRFKPGFSPGALLGGDAIGQLAVYRRELIGAAPDSIRSLARTVGANLSPAEVRHLPAVLLHRAAPPPPIVLTPDIEAAASTPAPLVTVVVLTKDNAALLKACTEGVLERTDYAPLELLIVDNGTAEPDALALLATLETRRNVRVLRQPAPFNFAAFNNQAAASARPGVLLLLNNDVEILESDWLADMVAQLARANVGIVGARLLYPDRTVQHAGMLLGPDGRATHVGRGAAADDPGYLGQLACVRDLSAVTGACLAIATETWHRVGGMDERLAVAWNDVDLCLRVRRAGLRVIWTPRATLLHREAATRGLESADAAKLARFKAEQALMQAEWGDALEHDPFLNPNLLALDSGALVLTRPRHALASTG